MTVVEHRPVVEPVETKLVHLGDIASFVRGITFKPADLEPPNDENIDCMRTKNVQSVLDTTDVWSIPGHLMKRSDQLLQLGDILISSANSWNLVGKGCWIPELERPTTFGGFVAVLRAHSDKVDARYLYRWFTSNNVQETLRSFGNQTTNISNLNLKRSALLQLPLPPLPEQRRIAAILDKADHLRTQRLEALAQLDALARSMFDALFGGLTDNLMTLKQAGLGFVSGKSLVASGTDGEPNDFVLKVNAVSSGRFDASQVKGLPPKYRPPVAHRVAVGDLIVTRASGSKDLIGVATVVDQVGDNVYLPDKLWKATFTGGRTLPEFFRWLTFSPQYRAHVANVSSGAAGVSNISQANLLSFEISLPPLELQQAFARRVAGVERLKEKHRAQLAELDILFASLQHRAFGNPL